MPQCSSFLMITTLLCSTLSIAVSVPACQLHAPKQKNLTPVKSERLQVDGPPFGLAFAKQKNIAFVALNHTLGVLDTSNLKTKLLHQVPLPITSTVPIGEIENYSYPAEGITLTPDGKSVLVTQFDSTLLVVDAEKAIANDTNAVTAILNGTAAAGAGAIEVTAYQNYAFVSQERGSNDTHRRGTIEVFNLPKQTKFGLQPSTVGYIPLGQAVVGTALSKDKKYLFATSEIGNDAKITMLANTTEGPIPAGEGTLSTLDVKTLTSFTSQALVSNVTAGCGAVRVEVSPDGKVAWVTARESNSLLAFDTKKLVSEPHKALIATVQVGQSPIGHVFARNGKRILTADSNRFRLPNATSGLSVVDVKAALNGKGQKAVLGSIPTGSFPRELALSPDGSRFL
ncbi:hypothetical protein HII31_09269 [Pseudocercospora fuligena]|uniref:YncE family protein n=1 Tax=Pseudocercospora fuligena TaxID=685502 RepID=A0A8H6REF2_9PEZI|nr:hypothetical protein HII31_09269 [Pseudocercospora fuligena]